MLSIANWYDVRRSSSAKTSRKNGRSTSSRMRPEISWRSSDSCSVMSGVACSRSRLLRNGSLHRISRAMSCGWPIPDRIAAISAVCEPCRTR